MSPVSPADMTKIRNKFTDLDQDALPLDVDTTPAGQGKTKAKSVKSVKWAFCPQHTDAGKRTGLVQRDAKTLVFRDHNKTVGKHTMPCPGSGEPYEGDTTDEAT